MVLDLYVREYGRGPLVLIVIHGGPDWDHSYLSRYVEPLKDLCRVILFDIRGCGRSARAPSSDGYQVDSVVDDIIRLMGERQIHEAILLGFSFGGRVALRFLQRNRSRIQALILASSTAYDDFEHEFDSDHERAARKAVCDRETKKILDRADADYALKTRDMAFAGIPMDIYNPDKFHLAEKVLAEIAFSGAWMERWLSGKLMTPKGLDYASIIRAAGVPCAIIHGERDMRFPVAVAHRLGRAVPDADLWILPKVGHLAHIEAPEAWEHAARCFIERISRSA